MHQVVEVLLWIAAAMWLVLFIQAMLNWALVPDISKGDPPKDQDWPLVSIIVPARNEEWLIREAVSSFCRQDYPHFEVIVVDDRSTDATPQILAELKQEFDNLTVLQGREPTEGWLGKPNALEIARQEAKGEWILVVDADAIYDPQVLRKGMGLAKRQNADMCALLPRMTTEGIAEGVLMSTYNFVNCVIAPLFLISRTKSKRVAAGSPVFCLVRSDALEACGAFECVRNVVLDDVAIGFRIKAAGRKLAVAYAGPLIRRRMYNGARATIEGFIKIAYPSARQFPGLFPLYFILGAIGHLLPYYGFAASLSGGPVSVPAVMSLVLMHLVFGWISFHFREPWYTIFLNPLRELGWWWIYIRSFLSYWRHGIVWRDRKYAAT
jgi:glycosyltransferase involved in cell wall biosynthesis